MQARCVVVPHREIDSPPRQVRVIIVSPVGSLGVVVSIVSIVNRFIPAQSMRLPLETCAVPNPSEAQTDPRRRGRGALAGRGYHSGRSLQYDTSRSRNLHLRCCGEARRRVLQEYALRGD